MTDSDELDVEQLALRVPGHFDARVVEIAPFAEFDHASVNWRDAIAFLRSGVIDVVCTSGGYARFHCGDMLCLAPLSLRVVRNASAETARLVLIARRAA